MAAQSRGSVKVLVQPRPHCLQVLESAQAVLQVAHGCPARPAPA